MQVNIYWITEVANGRIGIMPRPRGGDWLEDEIQALREANVDAVISLLEASEVAELDLELEAEYCRRLGIDFLAFPIADRQVPSSLQATKNFAQTLFDRLSQNKSLVIHCRQGIGRSSMLAACVITLAGITVDEAFAHIAEARQSKVPDTQEQRDWVKRLVDYHQGF